MAKPTNFPSYEERLKTYFEIRNRIFREHPSITKKSSSRIRTYYKDIKDRCRLIISSMFGKHQDWRCYATVSFLNSEEQGLLDTGANVSCIGSSLAEQDFSKHPEFKVIKPFVKTADGRPHDVIGVINVQMRHKDQQKPIQLYVIPFIKQRLILGVDFWRIFSLAPNIISAVEINSDLHRPCNSNVYPLTTLQLTQLDVVTKMFPNCSNGPGRTSLMQHHIDVGEAKPVKQRYYPVSPAVEKLLFVEIDRMLELGVIEPSSSAWSSPMRLVLKPNKVRLCLDARKLNEATKKDAYPLPSIDGIFSRLPKPVLITKLDLKDAYWQIELTEKLCIWIPGRFVYRIRRLFDASFSAYPSC